MKEIAHRVSYCFAVLFVILIFLGTALAQHVQFFEFGGTNGSGPDGGVTPDAAGNLYGVTASGGSVRLGVVYELSPAPGGVTEAVLYSFLGNGDGALPVGELIFDGAGNLYGVTTIGGAFGQGTVFELSPPSSPAGQWTETILHSFQGSPWDGAQPMAGLAWDAFGNLYGTTSGGGFGGNCPLGIGCGTVFELSPPAVPGAPWTETELYLFQGNRDGDEPLGALVFDHAGNLYGTTYNGGFEEGTIFELSPPPQQGGSWGETILHRFIFSDGYYPEAGLALENGALFGTTSEGGTATGGGTVFALLPPSTPGGEWSLAVLYAPAAPHGGIRGGITVSNPHTLYGVSSSGTLSRVFQISDAGGPVVVTIYNLGLSSAAGNLTIYNGALYGTAGGGYQNNGLVFELSR